MATESQFSKQVMELKERICPTGFSIVKGKALLYRLEFDSEHKLIDPDTAKEPPRGGSGKSYAAFETDLCVINDKEFPRVVLEFKTRITTHDILIYSAKAKKHKLIYPSLRYGLVIENESKIHPRFFTHNESLDFCVAVGDARNNEEKLVRLFKELIEEEICASNFLLDTITNGKREVRSYSMRAVTKPL